MQLAFDVEKIMLLLLRIFCTTMFLACAQSVNGTFCSTGCNCTNRKVIECAGTGLRSMPMRISPIVSELIANDNNIIELPPRMLSNANTLQKLNLSRNKIDNLRSSAFKNTISLTHLDLSHNMIRVIRTYTFFELSKLRVLNLEGNNITGISERAFVHVNSLLELTLSNNKLRTIPSKLLEKHSSLKVLKVDGNRISTLAKDVFKSQSALRLLDLSKNRIKQLSVEVFQNLHLLQELQLYRNQIQELDRGLTDILQTRCMNKANSSMPTPSVSAVQKKVFAQMTLLEILDIGSNNLKIVTYESFRELVHLKSFVLKKNPWRCDCALEQAVQTFPQAFRHAVWDEATCDKPNDLKKVKVGKLFLNKDPMTAYPAPLHVTDNTIAPTDFPITTENDVSQMTSTIGRHVGNNQSDLVETRHRRGNDSVGIPTVNRPFFKTLAVAITEEPRTSGNNLEDASDTIKPTNIPDKWWMVAAISAAIFIGICGTLCGINKCLNKGPGRERSPSKRSRGDESSFRTSSSNSRFFDYQFANRPLPQAPNGSGRQIARNTRDEVRSSKRERCGSNTSGFISMRTYSNESNAKGNNHSIVIDGKYQRGRMRSSTNASIETTETKFTDSNPGRNKLPPLPCDNATITMTAAEKPFREITATKTYRNITTRTGEGREKITNDGINADRDAQNSLLSRIQQGSDPPPPPKRSESSKLRCQELLRKKKLCEAYCEISAPDKGKGSSFEDNILYKKYLQKMIDPYYSSQFSIQNFDKSGNTDSPKASKFVRQSPSQFEYDEHYDRLSYNTRKRYDDTVDRFMNSTKDSCFNLADNDFVFSCPTEEEKLRRSSTGRLFQLRKQQANVQRRSMVVGKSPLAGESLIHVKKQADKNHIGIRAQSFSHAPRSISPSSHGQATPAIVVHQHENNKFGIPANQRLPNSDQYQHLHFTHSDTLPEANFICPSEIPEERTSDADMSYMQDTTADPVSFERKQLKMPHKEHCSIKSENSDATHAAASDKEEMEELKSLVQSILRSDKGDSKPVSRADSIKDDSSISRSNSNCGLTGMYLATPNKTFLNITSEIDLTESDDAGYLSPMTTLRKNSNVEEEEIFGEIQIQDHHKRRNHNKRGSAKNKKVISGQRKTRKSSSNHTVRNSNDERYSSSESDDQYDTIPRKRMPKPPRQFQKAPIIRTPSELDSSSVYMSIIDANDPSTQPKCTDSNKDTTTANDTEDAFYSREREIYIKASQMKDYEENCYEEIYSRQDSINPQQQPIAHKPYFSALKSKQRPEENYYQEVTKPPPEKPRNKMKKIKTNR